MTRLRVTDVRLARAPRRDRRSGLVGFVSFTVNGLRVDACTLRRTVAGDHRISLPRRRGHPVVRPLTVDGIRALEAQVLAALGLEAGS